MNLRRTAFSVFSVWVTIATSLAGSPSQHYQSPHTELSYLYEMQGDETTSELWDFQVRSESDDLRMAIRSGRIDYSVSIDFERTGERSTVTYTAPGDSDAGEFRLAGPDPRVEGHFRGYADATDLSRVAGEPPDCDSMLSGEMADALHRIIRLIERDYLRYLEPPRHLEVLVVALHIARVPPMLAGDCEDANHPAAGACYYDNATFGDCVHCCEDGMGFRTILCLTAFRSVCRGAACAAVSGLVCGGAGKIQKQYCMGYNCRGKPGDPQCDQSAPCEGNCMSFCGIGWGAACGDCSAHAPYRTECCQ
jgi:hypothetical protein